MNIEFQQVDDAMLEGLENKQEFIDAEIKKFDEKIKYAEEVHGDTEVRDVIIEKAEFYTKVKQSVNAKETFLKALDKTIGVSKRLEVIMFILQIAFLDADVPEMKKYIDKSLKLLEEGGDWERKNKLKVFKNKFEKKQPIGL
jgi:26S proteasome regulatory subunit N7